MTASIITIGDEILIGQVIDTNSAWIGRHLNDIGIEVVSIHSVQDTMQGIHTGLNQALAETDLVIMTGGLGPTKDDITKKAIAEYLEDQFIFDTEMWKDIQSRFEKRGRSTTDAHYNQCYMPSKAKRLKNAVSTAPGMSFEYQGKSIISLPGVPYEMKWIMENEVLPSLNDQQDGLSIVHKTVLTAGEGETRLNILFEDIEQQLPSYIKLAFLPAMAKVRIRLTGKAYMEKSELIAEVDQYARIIAERVKDFHYGYDEESLEMVIGRLCMDKSITIGTAESCTGGLLSSILVSVPGSSRYYKGGIVSYSYEMKHDILGVSWDIMNSLGAVSQETVTQMVKGACHVCQCDVAIAISGTAGPGGGTPEKPVGTVWLACGTKDKIETIKLTLGEDRDKNIGYSANYGLFMLFKLLSNV